MRPVEIKEGVHWIGVVDWNCRNFHGYARSANGTTYNAFYIEDEKKVLVDTVSKGSEGEFLCSLSHLTKPEEIDYIVVNHLEPDHAGCLEKMVEICKPEKIFVSVMGGKNIATFFDSKDWPVHVVKPGEEVSIGKRTLRFYETRMLHWPDNMFTFVPEDKLLFTSDAFGQNIAASERWVDEMSKEMVADHMQQYYANIITPYSSKVIKTLETFAGLNLDVDMICPDHGLMFRGEDCAFALEKYMEFAKQEPKQKATLFYDTMWSSTERMINAVASGLVSEGISVKVMSVKANHHSDIMSEVFDSAAIVIGSPTHNNGILPGMADALTYVKGLRPQNKIGAAVGSFGWSGECVNILNEWLEKMSCDIIEPQIKAKNRPDHDTLKECFQLGVTIAAAIKEKTAK
ncbi:FprA family A-type flavoprotein [Maridesulfovibrio salexigens]|uniref:Beta-lactamase domain protein n=1 Tax=Maridesulfovibrio salexigens (strain ATCC 14822 / DSM 2638 / NCIMB 8403 / VKM B-1763) TaxID=526222 RepID=C6BV19_MARSD|nr:FprA family A-type flavoprotein [Maridesulfovibrio salexigens]ACS78156.1 beta-lactamase domain protein [Maridesulfovibrio salexigens DSM 2638]